MDRNAAKRTKLSILLALSVLIIILLPIQLTTADYIDLTFTPTNEPPIILNEIPTNGSMGLELKPICSIDVIDLDGNPMNIYWYENTTGNWVLRKKHTLVPDCTYQWTFAQATKHSTKYWWKVAVNDSSHNITAIFHFTTKYVSSIPNIKPIAKITGPDQGYVNQTLVFYAYDSYDPDGRITGYRWDFNNDGLFDTDWSDEIYVIRKYSKPGNYTIKLQVKDTMADTSEDTHTITVLQLEPTQQLPIAEANGPYEGYTNESVNFSSYGSYDINGTILNYTWYFGDNEISYLANPSHTYSAPGYYLVILIVTNNQDLTNMDIATAHITNRTVIPAKEKGFYLCIPLFLILAIIVTIIALLVYKKYKNKTYNSS